MTDIQWYFNNYGPYVDDVVDESISDPDINVIQTETMYGTPKTLVQYVGDGENINLNDAEREIVDGVITATRSKYWNSFIKYVYDIFPVKSCPRYSILDLSELAEEERRAG